MPEIWNFKFLLIYCGSLAVLFSLGVDGKNNLKNLKKCSSSYFQNMHSGRFWTDPFKVTYPFTGCEHHVHPCTCVLNNINAVYERIAFCPWNIPVFGIFLIIASEVEILGYLTATTSVPWKSHKTASVVEILPWRQCFSEKNWGSSGLISVNVKFFSAYLFAWRYLKIIARNLYSLRNSQKITFLHYDVFLKAVKGCFVV